jgi:hypothetical protein
MVRKKERSSEGVVVTEVDGGEQLWAVKGREVSIVRVVRGCVGGDRTVKR